MGRELICLWVGDVEICQELMTFMILFGFLPHSLVSVLIYRFLNKTNDTCVNSTENRFTKRHLKYLCDIAALGPRLQG